MFELPALAVDDELLHRIGAAGGFCDGGDCLGDAKVEAGWPFFGQYVAHDLTADRSPLRAHVEVATLINVRSPRANLESLYGGGPTGTPFMYSRSDPAKLLENDGDLPRNQEGFALIGDPRNDVHTFMNQMQVAFIRAHNLLVDRLRERRLRRVRSVQRGPACALLALPVGDRQRLPPRPGRIRDRRSGAGGRRPLLQAAGRAVHSGRVRRRRVPLRALADPPALSDRRGRTRARRVPRPRRVLRARRPPRRLGADVRRARTRAGPARQADRRPAPPLVWWSCPR